MKHARFITRVPVQAQTSFCTNIESDYQALLCFMLQILTGFFLPLAEIKRPADPESYNDDAAA